MRIPKLQVTVPKDSTRETVKTKVIWSSPFAKVNITSHRDTPILHLRSDLNALLLTVLRPSPPIGHLMDHLMDLLVGHPTARLMNSLMRLLADHLKARLMSRPVDRHQDLLTDHLIFSI